MIRGKPGTALDRPGGDYTGRYSRIAKGKEYERDFNKQKVLSSYSLSRKVSDLTLIYRDIDVNRETIIRQPAKRSFCMATTVVLMPSTNQQ
jgi:hypothetical protein